MEERCEICKFFKECRVEYWPNKFYTDKHGECKKLPESIIKKATDWCGEFKKKL